MTKTASSVWNECLSFIQDNIKQQAYKTWFEPIKPIKLSGEALTIQVPSRFFYEWLEEHYIKLLRVALIKQLVEDAKLIYESPTEVVSNEDPFVIQNITLP